MIRISLLIAFCLVTLLGSSIGNEQGPNNPQKADTTAVAAKDSLNITTPNANKELNGVVEVSFRIDSDGEVEIVNISADNAELMEYVLQKFKNIKLDPKNYSSGKTIKYKFEFKKQA